MEFGHALRASVTTSPRDRDKTVRFTVMEFGHALRASVKTPPRDRDKTIRFTVHRLGPDGRSWSARADVEECSALASALSGRTSTTSYAFTAMIVCAISGGIVGFAIGLLWRCP